MYGYAFRLVLGIERLESIQTRYAPEPLRMGALTFFKFIVVLICVGYASVPMFNLSCYMMG